jgi:hypothetical protein
MCTAQTVCRISPKSGDVWYIQAFESDPCKTNESDGDKSLHLGLGLGFGLPVLFTIGSYLTYRYVYPRDKVLPDRERSEADAGIQMSRSL